LGSAIFWMMILSLLNAFVFKSPLAFTLELVRHTLSQPCSLCSCCSRPCIVVQRHGSVCSYLAMSF
jgi:hypothetical protein